MRRIWLLLLVLGSLLALCIYNTTRWAGSPPARGISAVISKTSDYSIAGTEAFGSIFTNSGASAPVKLTLPTCLSGMTVTALVTAAQTFQVGPQATDQIIGPGLTTTSAAGSKISNDGSVLYSLVQLVGICPQWVVAQTMGGEWIDAGP